MTDEREYLLKAIAALEDARAYVDHVQVLIGLRNKTKVAKSIHDCNTWQDVGLIRAYEATLSAYDNAVTVYEGLK